MKHKRILCGVMTFVLCCSMVQGVHATTIEEAQQKANELEKQKDSAKSEQSALENELNDIIEKMNQSKEKLNKKQEEIQKSEDQLVEAKVNENAQYTSMKKRIKYMYENGNSQFIDILLESENIGDFLNKADYVSQISEYDRNMLTEFQKVVKDVEKKEESLKAEYSELEKCQNDLIAQQENVETYLSEKNIQIADLEKKIGDNAAVLQELIAEAEAEAERQRQEAEAAAAAAAAAAAQQQSYGGSSYVAPSSNNVVASGSGQFTNPCPGAVVSSTFGYRDFDSSFHNGLDLAAGEGTPTYAADSGTVIIAGWSNSAGNWVVIDHGNGFVTKYMHHSALAVSAGQYVSRGQQIGYVGNTGNSFGAHLHFQIELNGSPVDPQAYL